MFQIYRPTIISRKAASEAINLEGWTNALESTDPMTQLVALKSINVWLDEDSASLGKLITATKAALQSEQLKAAANVDVDDINEVFTATNTIDRNWIENDTVTLLSDELAMYSTSVCDLVTKGDKCWLVASVGLIEICNILA